MPTAKNVFKNLITSCMQRAEMSSQLKVQLQLLLLTLICRAEDRGNYTLAMAAYLIACDRFYLAITESR